MEREIRYVRCWVPDLAAREQVVEQNEAEMIWQKALGEIRREGIEVNPTKMTMRMLCDEERVPYLVQYCLQTHVYGESEEVLSKVDEIVRVLGGG
jgi:hypothetical protein